MQQQVYQGYIYEQQADGSWQRVGPASPQPVTVGRPDPTISYEVPKVQADIASTNANIGRTVVDTEVTRGTAPTTIQTNQAPEGFLWIDPANPMAGITPIKGYNPSRNQGVKPEKVAALRALEAQIAEVERLYKEGPGATKGVLGIQDYLPTDANSAFNSAAAGLGEAAQAAFRIEGSGDQNASELAQRIAAQVPSASDKDAEIQQKLKFLKTRLETATQELGLPPPKYDLTGGARDPRNDGMTAGQAGEKFKTERDMEIEARINALISGGASLEQINGELAGLGLPPLKNNKTQEQLDAFRAGGGRFEAQPTGVRTQEQETLGAVAMNPAFAGAAGVADATTLGMMRALNPGAMDAVEAENPMSALGGQIVGTALGTAGIGALARNTVGRAVPKLMQGGAGAQFGRNLGADVAYGAGYGAVTEGDPLSGALAAGVGSAGGQALGKVAGAGLAGVSMAPAAQTLRDAGVRLTGGRMLGPVASKIEDRMASVPFVGDAIAGRQLDAFNDFNQAAFREAGAPIGYNPQGVGYQGVQDFGDAVGRAYDDATAGAVAPFDNQFMQDFAAASGPAQSLPPDLRRGLGQVLDARVQPLTDAGQMTGEQYQQAMRALKATRSNPPQRFQGFEQDYRDSVSNVMDALTGQMSRAAPDVAPKLESANKAYRGLKTIQNATERAKGGAGSGELYTFTPSQLQMAIQATGRKFPGDTPLRQLADAGQEVLPSTVPNSGSADRIAQMAMAGGGLAAIGGAGAGAGYLAGGAEAADDGAKISAALAALAMLGGTRGGQAVTRTIMDPSNRPAIGKARDYLRKKRKSGSALFGNTGVALGLASQ